MIGFEGAVNTQEKAWVGGSGARLRRRTCVRSYPRGWERRALKASRGATTRSLMSEHPSEDKRGLRVIARLDGGAEGRRVGALLQDGKLDGLSFGYRVREARPGAHRELIDVDLVEVSLVAKPMQRLARVHAVERVG